MNYSIPAMASEEKSLEIVRKSYPEQIPPVGPVSVPYGDYEGRTAHLREYLNVILARRASFAAVLLTVLGIGIISIYKQTPVYRANVTIEIDREDTRVLSFEGVAPTLSAADDVLQTQFKILASEALAKDVVQDLHLDKEKLHKDQPKSVVDNYYANLTGYLANLFSAVLPPGSTAVTNVPADAGDRLRPYVNDYLDALSITPVLRTRLVVVGVDNEDPRLAARIANAHAEHFIEQNLRFKWDETQTAADFLRKELENMRANLEKSEDNLQAYSQDHQIFAVEESKNAEGRNTETDRLTELEAAYTKAQTDRIVKEAAARQAKRLVGSSVDPSEATPGTLVGQLIELQRQDAALSARFQPGYGPRKEIQNQIETISKAIEVERADRVKRADNEYATALDRERAFKTELEKQGQQVNRLKQENIQYGILKREADSNRQLYDGLLLRLKEAGISSSLKASNIRIVDRAQVPLLPLRPDKKRGLINTLVLGLALAIGFVFFQEYMDSSVKSPDDVSKQFKLPTLGLIPRFHKAGVRETQYGYLSRALAKRESSATGPSAIELISYSAPSSIYAEAYRSLRASLILSSSDHPPRTILVTSAVPSEGKTATAANIAISLTQTGARVLLIDADMRRPRVDGLFSLRNKPGLSNFLTGTAELENVIHKTHVPELFVLPCGTIPPNPGELILSSRFREMVNELQGLFAYVVIDSPPLSNVSDGRIIATTAEAVVFVVRALSTSRHVVSRTLEQLEKSRARVVGVVLNDYDIQKKGNYYYPYYKYTYAHGYKTEEEAFRIDPADE